MCMGRQQNTAEVLGSLLFMWETQMEFLMPALNLAESLGSEQQTDSLSFFLSLSVCHSPFEINNLLNPPHSFILSIQ